MLITVIGWILFVWLAIPVVYFFVYAMASKGYKENVSAYGKGERRFVILIPAYKSDSCIFETAKAALEQDYPREKFRVLVISDSMATETIEKLGELPVEVLEVSFEESTKAKSLAAAFGHLGPDAADEAVILDADNIIANDFLRHLDNAFENGARAVQAHRTAKNRDTDVAVIDAVSEEINNSIFRKGHNKLGVSSALIGSGMAFEYAWLCENMAEFSTSGEDKEMELKLLKDGIFVHYLDYVQVLDEKTRSQGNYYNQRRRWTASQHNLFGGALSGLKAAKDRFGYFDKLFQWTFPPRMIIMVLTPLLAIVATILKASGAGLWWCLTALLAVALWAGTPRQQRDAKLLKSLLKVPVLAALSVANIFRMKGTKDKFIHTQHK